MLSREKEHETQFWKYTVKIWKHWAACHVERLFEVREEKGTGVTSFRQILVTLGVKQSGDSKN